jgi:hypothetical protein
VSNELLEPLATPYDIIAPPYIPQELSPLWFITALFVTLLSAFVIYYTRTRIVKPIAQALEEELLEQIKILLVQLKESEHHAAHHLHTTRQLLRRYLTSTVSSELSSMAHNELKQYAATHQGPFTPTLQALIALEAIAYAPTLPPSVIQILEDALVAIKKSAAERTALRASTEKKSSRKRP